MQQSRLKKMLATRFAGVKSYLECAQGVIFGTRGEHDISTDLGARFHALYVPNGVSQRAAQGTITVEERSRLTAAAPAAESAAPPDTLGKFLLRHTKFFAPLPQHFAIIPGTSLCVELCPFRSADLANLFGEYRFGLHKSLFFAEIRLAEFLQFLCC